ncbi:MAG: hemin-degrading factor [Alphaproteobacteria bacterium]|nr:hemin-degrading factor [Alphaproteobacteria bacterium]
MAVNGARHDEHEGNRLAGAELLAAFVALRERHPRLRARDAAAELGVSEAELLAARVGEEVVRLQADWADVVRALPALGPVMALTRNAHCVHEKHGRFDKVSIGPGHGLVLNEDIDLRLFMGHWRYGFAVTEEVASGRRKSLQFFDLDGSAVHKVYLTEESDLSAHNGLLERFRAVDQSAPIEILSLPDWPHDRPDMEIARSGLLDHWAALQDTHDFHAMLQEVGAGRLQAMRLAAGVFTRRLAPMAVRLLLEGAVRSQTPIMCFVGNPGCIQIHTGPIGTVKPTGPWLNVLDPTFNLHLREDAVAHAYAVVKPTRDGDVTSLELFDRAGFCFCQFFGARKPGRPELEAWRNLVRSLPSDSLSESAS